MQYVNISRDDAYVDRMHPFTNKLSGHARIRLNEHLKTTLGFQFVKCLHVECFVSVPLSYIVGNTGNEQRNWNYIQVCAQYC